MSRRRRAAAILAAGVTLAGLIVGWPWLRPAVLEPGALLLWVLLRLFVLSVHQAVFWTGLVLAAAASLLALLRAHAIIPLLLDPPTPAWRPRGPVESWRQRIDRAADGAPPAPTIGWDGFLQLVVSLQALELRVPADHRLYDALRDGRVPLPPSVHAYLFAATPPRPGGAHPLRPLWGRLTEHLRRRSNRDRARRLSRLSELLSYLEDSLEIPRHAPEPRAPRPADRRHPLDGG